ncbi:MAG: hypothetical protein EBV86_14110 [Marivivens sp.]|nr:hypothetical protein [Marivivens sp.]
MSKKMPRVEFVVTPEERKMLDSEAEIMNCTRQELIRDRLFTKRVGRQTIDLAIETVTRRYQGIPRHQLEPIVCTVICALAAEG